MTLAPGSRLGAYAILSAVGAGGMGEVYKARDTKLDRDVAIKVLPPALAADPDRIARLEREAKTLASLNHPNIAHIYGLEDSTSPPALVMEFVDGPTLADRIARGPIPLDEALPIARQIAEALEAAHEQGIIHRDLKPANIKVREDGAVKVLDFGLAKALEPLDGGPSAALANSPTITSPALMTGVGVLLGTAAYMSPEQAKGKPADKRSDIWAFGCLLYEMLTGRRAFAGDDVSDTLASVLKSDPDWNGLPDDVPSQIRVLLQRCLAKDRTQRVPDISIARFLITEPVVAQGAPSVSASALRPRRPWKRAAPAVLTGVVVVSTVTWGAATWIARTTPSPPAVVRFSIDLAGQIERPTATGLNPVAISPDGSRLAYIDNQRLYLRALDQADPAPIAGSDTGGTSGFARAPFFSPDGRWVAFWQERQLRKVAVGSGAVVTICDAPGPPFGASWGPNDEILWGTGVTGILHVKASGGRAESLIAMKTGELAVSPQVLPGGEWVLFLLRRAGTSADQGQVVVQSRATGERRVLIEGARDVRYLASKHLLYGRGNTILAQAFDPAHLTLNREPVRVLDGVATALVSSGLSFFRSSPI
jgi:serine/threonine-protein kinase